MKWDSEGMKKYLSRLTRAYASYAVARVELGRLLQELKSFPDEDVRELASRAYGVIVYDPSVDALDDLVDVLASVLSPGEGGAEE